MFKLMCLVVITFNKLAFSRHILETGFDFQQMDYLPYSVYGYDYAKPYQYPYHSFLYSPPGTYFDQRRGILRPFPGGGVPILVDYHKRCSNQYIGIKAHPKEHQYYYVCKPDCVIFGKCQNLQIFNTTSGQCIQQLPPEYIPTCTSVGRFPLFSDCHLYYKCEEDLQPKIYACPPYMIFSPASQKCINGNKCTPTQISPDSSYIPEYCVNKFPPCYENGTFRSTSDCSLYYSCDLQKGGIYLQTRLRCPKGKFYDLKINDCLPAEEVPCDCIQVAELVYPKAYSLPFYPPVYPPQFDLASLEENIYPIEKLNEDIPLNNCYNISEIENKNVSESVGKGDDQEIPSTTTTIVMSDITITPETELSLLGNDAVLNQKTYKTTTNSFEESTSFEKSSSDLISSQKTKVTTDTTITPGDIVDEIMQTTIASSTEILKNNQATTQIVTATESREETSTDLAFHMDELTSEETTTIIEEIINQTTIFPRTLMTFSTTKSCTMPCYDNNEIYYDGNKTLPTVVEPPCLKNNNGNIPQLEIIAERPIDVHFQIYSSKCDEEHKHNLSASSDHTVFLRWFPNKSNQTISFETASEIKTTKNKDF